MIILDLLDHDPGIRHAFFTRQGGVSGGLFASLNCGFGSGDAAETVARNRAIAMERLGFSPDRLVTCYQVHSTTVVTVGKPWPRDAAPRAGGLLAWFPGVASGFSLPVGPRSCSRMQPPMSSVRHMVAGAARSAGSSRPLSTGWRCWVPSGVAFRPVIA